MDTTHQHPEGTLFVLTHPEDVQGDQWRSPHLSTFSVKDMQEPFHEELRNRYPRTGAKGVEGSPTANPKQRAISNQEPSKTWARTHPHTPTPQVYQALRRSGCADPYSHPVPGTDPIPFRLISLKLQKVTTAKSKGVNRHAIDTNTSRFSSNDDTTGNAQTCHHVLESQTLRLALQTLQHILGPWRYYMGTPLGPK